MFFKQKKRRNSGNDQEDEEVELDLDWMYLLGRSKFMLKQEELETCTYAEWASVFHAYKMIWNFEAKKMIYKDIEEENAEYRRTHQPIEDINNL